MTLLHEVHGLTAADVMHRRVSTVPAAATVGDVRDYFAASSSRRLAVVVDGSRYAGSIAREAIAEDVDPSAPATDHATYGPLVDERADASVARDMALDQPSRRVPVVDDGGLLVGIVAINQRLDGFCGT
jgi:CBS-domain-containing membrane protein